MNNTGKTSPTEDNLSHQDLVTFSSGKEQFRRASENPNLPVLNHDLKEESNGIQNLPVYPLSHQNLSGIAETYRRTSKYSVEKNKETMVKIKTGRENIRKSNPNMLKRKIKGVLLFALLCLMLLIFFELIKK